MTLHKYYNDILPLLREPLSVIKLAETGCLPPVLHISNIALLMHPDDKNLQEGFAIILKRLIERNILPALTHKEYSKLIDEREAQRNTDNYIKPIPPGQLSPIKLTIKMRQETDFLECDTDLDDEDQRLLIIHRNELKKWLENEDEWPLSPNNLLSQWWAGILPNNGNSAAGVADKPIEDFYFRLERDFWQIRFHGKAYSFKNTIGIQYIAHLIQRSYNDEPEIHVAQLYNIVKGFPYERNDILSKMGEEQLNKMRLQIARFGDAGDIVTSKGRSKMIAERNRLKEEMEDAKELGRTETALRLRESIENIEDYMKKASGLSNRSRKASDINEKIRKTIGVAINRAIMKIGKNEMDDLALYLDDHIIKGIFCGFRKDPEIDWKIYM